MATLPTKPFRKAPMQRLTVKPIEHPAEQAALDERLKHSEAAMGDDSRTGVLKERVSPRWSLLYSKSLLSSLVAGAPKNSSII
jgi:hypothetical protein